jgi:hypothetical protein
MRGDSIIDTWVELNPLNTSEVHVWPLYFIKPRDFAHRADDPDLKHQGYNRAAMELLPKQFGVECGTVDDEAIYLDLPHIARRQFLRRGIPARNIHMEHAYLADELPTTRKGGGRYLVAIVRL